MLAPLLLLGCATPATDSAADTADLRTCDTVLAEYAAEEAAIRTCDDAAECGQVLTGTSCGCTRNAVARTDADVADFYALQAEAGELGCSFGDSTCDCPEADGYDCVEHQCTWNYVTDPGRWGDCRAADGYATEIVAVAVEGDELVVGVEYGGGCSTHTFSTCWPDGSFMESDPVQVSLELLHEADAPDPCDMWVSDEMRLDLTPLRVAWVESYGTGAGTVVIHLGGFTADYVF